MGDLKSFIYVHSKIKVNIRSKDNKKVKLTPTQILSRNRKPVQLNNKKALNDGTARVKSVKMSTSRAVLKDQVTGEIRPLDTINGVEIPRIIFEIDVVKLESVENADSTFATEDETDANGNVVVRATQKTVVLSNIRQLRKLYGLSAPFDGTTYYVLCADGEFFAEDPIHSDDVEDMRKDLSGDMKILELTESEFYYVRYVGRAAQGLPLEEFEYSYVKREGGITWFTEDGIGPTMLSATV